MPEGANSMETIKNVGENVVAKNTPDSPLALQADFEGI